MEISDDNLRFWINRDNSTFQGAEAFRPLLERLDVSFLASPIKLKVGGRAEREVISFLDSYALKALEQRKDGLKFSDQLERMEVNLRQIPHRTIVSIYIPATGLPSTEETRHLFMDLVSIVAPTYANCHLERLGEALHNAHYSTHSRTFYADGLYWLNFFGPEEEARQGGSALANNPYARVERLPQGLFMQVGEGPFDATTPEGERLLIKATAAMPPLRDTPSGQTSSAEDTQMIELTTVDGISGYLESEDQGFWVTKNISPNTRLDSKAIAKLKGLVGKGSPAIAHVNILFSLQEAAENNLAELSAVGIHAWYVDLETGKPRLVIS